MVIEQLHDLDFTQTPVRVPNVSRLDLGKWLRELDFRVGAEIGVAEGEYSKILCELNPQMKIYGVDSWEPYEGYGDYTREKTFQVLYDEAVRRLDPYIKRGRYEIIEKFSFDAASDFEDESLDFVYIDANHQDPFITQDINLWSKKVRSGGIVAGHDYSQIKRVKWDVRGAIHKYTEENNISPWFVLGLDETTPSLVRDGSRSWMFFKP